VRRLGGPLRRAIDLLRRTPLHPQWLLGRREFPRELGQFSGTLLDIGAGDRWIAAKLPATARYLALDYPATGSYLYAATPDVFADAAALPLRDASMDGVVCLEVLEHVPDPARVIKEIARVLKPGASAWLSMPFLYPVHDAPFDFQRYTEHGLRRDVLCAGLELSSCRPSLHAVRSAGLLASLAVAGGVNASPGPLAALLLFPAAALVLAINLASFAFSLFWPDWTSLSAGHTLRVRRP
jgi:SAM-dependent methyltransferase